MAQRTLYLLLVCALLCACENERDNQYSVFRKEYRTNLTSYVEEYDGETYKSQSWFQFDYNYEKLGNGHLANGSVTYKGPDDQFFGAI